MIYPITCKVFSAGFDGIIKNLAKEKLREGMTVHGSIFMGTF